MLLSLSTHQVLLALPNTIVFETITFGLRFGIFSFTNMNRPQRNITSAPHAARYYWEYRTGDSTTYALIDRVTTHEIATVTYLSTVRKWRWMRHTTRLLHGADAADGVAKLLADAKSCVEDGLPLEM